MNNLSYYYFPDDTTGYAVGELGTILKASGGGFPVSINEYSACSNSLKIYPNPGNDIINLETAGNGLLSILDIRGKTVWQQSITEHKTTIDISSLPGGVYILKLIGEKGVQVGKLIKQ